MENSKALGKFLREEANKEIITKYMFIKSKEEKYSDEYINAKYRINPATIRNLYNKIDQNERLKLESILKKQIESGEKDLDELAAIWHRQALMSAKKGQANKKENKGEER